MQVDNLMYNSSDIRNDIPELSNEADQLIELLKESRYIFEQLFIQRLDFNLSKEEEKQITTQITNIAPVENYARIVQLVFQLNYYKLIFIKIVKEDLNITFIKQINNCIKKIEYYLNILEKQYCSK